MRALLVSLLLLVTAEPAMAFDCAKAAAPLDKAICAQPELAAMDDAMTASYNRLRALLADKDKQALLAYQRIWLRQRAKNCVDDATIDRDCIASLTRDRQAELANHLHGAEGAPRILPLYRAFTDKRQKYAIVTATPVLSLADASRAALFNEQAQGWIAYEKNLKELKRAAFDGGHALLYSASYQIALSSPELISIGVSSYRYLGGAHGQPARMAFAYDPMTGRFFKRGDLFRDEASLLASVTDACRADLTRQHQAANNGLLFDDADPEPVIADFVNWLFTPGKLLIRFDVYTIAPYASGQIDCAIPVALLAPFAKVGVRLP